VLTRYAQTRTLSEADAAYIAGLVDGEGTLALSRRHARDRRQLVLSIANTELCLLEFVLLQVGAGKITRKRTAASRHTPSFVYTISNRQALALVEQLHPYLRSHKRSRAALVLSQYVALTPRNGKYSLKLEEDRAAFERAFLAISSRSCADREPRPDRPVTS
jgi:hypothetical protein